MNLAVSVLMITYAHEKYIREAIDGVLMQETNFEFELIISNDCSPDKTDEIICDYLKNHPKGHRIKYFNQKQNLGMNPNFVFALQQCKGKYIALCEGDDYWTEPSKLQIQFDFLESNKDYVLCFHDFIFLKNNIFTGRLSDNCTEKKDTYLFDDFISNGVVRAHTASYFFRNNLIKLPDDFYKCDLGDLALKIFISEHGKSKFIDKKMSVYRIHDNGTYSSESGTQLLKHLNTKKYINNYYKGKYKHKIFYNHNILILYFETIKYYSKQHDLKKTLYYTTMIFWELKFSLSNPYNISRLGVLKIVFKGLILKRT